MYVYGGDASPTCDGSKILKDLCALDLKTGAWSTYPVSSDAPAAGKDNVLCPSSATALILVCGSNISQWYVFSPKLMGNGTPLSSGNAPAPAAAAPAAAAPAAPAPAEVLPSAVAEPPPLLAGSLTDNLSESQLSEEGLRIGNMLLLNRPELRKDSKVTWKELGSGDNLKMLCALLRGNAIPTKELRFCWGLLGISHTEIGPDGGCLIGEALRTNTTLTELNLESNMIGDKGVKGVSEGMKYNTTLRELKLGWNDIQNEGVEVLCKMLKKNKTLTKVTLRYNKFGNDGFNSLKEMLKENKTLTELALEGTKPGEYQKSEMRNAWGSRKGLLII